MTTLYLEKLKADMEKWLECKFDTLVCPCKKTYESAVAMLEAL